MVLVDFGKTNAACRSRGPDPGGTAVGQNRGSNIGAIMWGEFRHSFFAAYYNRFSFFVHRHIAFL